jgi:hypothetical protein
MSIIRADGLFTLGLPPEQYHLPHPRLGLPVILLVRRVLIHAFNLLRERNFPLATALEDEITTALKSIIENDLRKSGKIAGFSKRTYDPVIRQGQVANYNQTKLTKTPDLCFRLRNDEEENRPVLSEHDALFVECKPVDGTHSVGGKYCDDGLCRFVEGDYAWAMEEGMMLAYSRKRTIAAHLIPALQNAKRHEQLKVADLPMTIANVNAAAQKHCEALHVSLHKRGFPWVANKGAATNILIYHSWHCCE